MKKRISRWQKILRDSLWASILGRTYFGLVILFIYIPIGLFALLAFNETGNISSLKDFVFSLKYFAIFFQSPTLINAILNTFAIAIIATFFSILIGTFAAIALWRMRMRTVNFVLSVNSIPLLNTDIVTAVALLVLFLALAMPFGFLSLLAAHISFCVPYVLLTVLTRIRTIDPNLLEASYDLGAPPFLTLRRIILPIIKPGIFVGAALAFANSFDDFIISYFNSGAIQNISTFIYTLKNFTPVVNVFFVFLLIIVVGGYVLVQAGRVLLNRPVWHAKRLQKVQQKLANAHIGVSKFSTSELLCLQQQVRKIETDICASKKRFAFWTQPHVHKIANISGILLLLMACLIFLIWYFIRMANMLNIAVYGSYIDDATIFSYQKLANRNINLITYSTNEELDAKLLTTNFSLIMPGEYFVDKFWKSKQIQKIDWNRLATTTRKYNNDIDPNHDGKWMRDNYFIPSVIAKIPDIESTNSTAYLDLHVPFYWGTIVAVTPDNDTHNDYNYGDIWNALINKKQIYLNDDMRNAFMLACQLMLSTAKYPQYQQYLPAGVDPVTIYHDLTYRQNKINHSQDGINPSSETAVYWASTFLINLEKTFQNFHYQGDEIQDTLGLEKYDLALCYSANVTYAKLIYPNLKAHVHYITDDFPEPQPTPQNMFGNNFWIDGFSICSHQSEVNLERIYDFLGYVLSHPINEHLSLDFTKNLSAVQATYDKQTASLIYAAGNRSLADIRYNIYFYLFPDLISDEYNKILAAASY